MKLTIQSSKWSAIALGAALAVASGCSAQGSDDGGALVGAEESGSDYSAQAIYGHVAAGSTLVATTGVNLRTGPSTRYRILHVVPRGAHVTVVDGSPNGGWYKIKHNGRVGWSFGRYYRKAGGGGGGGGGGGRPPSGGGGGGGGGGPGPNGAFARARAGVGFSYWWGHGRWNMSGPNGSTRGSCRGSCPSCSHGGSYGADCSGYVAKIWQVPSSNSNMSHDSHPYSTWNFENESRGWHRIGRDSLKGADALVYNSGGAGHIFLFEKGERWGSMWTYEARGCSYGIVHNVRSAGSAYRAIRRDGY